ncbi:MAG: diguanylate cyclase domain-containing protein, partial [Halanaerobiales bacterium]
SNVYSVVIIHEDITQRKLAERELKLQKEKLDETLMRYQMATNGAKLGVWDWNITTDEVKFNEMWSKMLDYEPDEIEGDFKSWENMIHPDDKERVFEKLNEHLRGESPFYQSEHRLKTGDGYWKWIYDIGSIVEYGTDSKPVRAVGIHQDINARKRSEEVVNTHKAYFQQLFDRSPEAIVILDNEERIMRINESFKRIFGYESSEIEGANINEIILPPDKKKEAELISDKVKNGQVYTGESARQAKNGRLINVNIKGYPIIIDNEQSGIYEIYEDITDRKIEEDKIKYLSFHDQLTDLYNRRYFENELERLSSTRKTPLSIIIGDLDGLKTVNDNLGHKEGDKYIKKAAEVIRSVIRSDDIAARIGGDEFAIILPDTEENESREIVKRIRKLFQENCSEYPGISLGLGVKENPEQNINKVFKTADRNMYYNKREKKRT